MNTHPNAVLNVNDFVIRRVEQNKLHYKMHRKNYVSFTCPRFFEKHKLSPSCCCTQRITLVNKKFVVWVFSADLGRIWCAESKNHIGFAQSGQVFELWPRVVFYVFVHIYARVEHFRRNWWGKMRCGIMILIGNDCFNDKKYSGPLVLGDNVEKGSV